MQQLKTVNELKSSIEKKIFYLLYILWIFVALIVVYQIDIANKKYQIKQQKIQNTFQIYFSQFSEKLSIIATSRNFTYFLNASTITQKKLVEKILARMSSLNEFGVIGIEIIKRPLFSSI